MMNNVVPKYSYLLLDWDGCLANTLPIWANSYMETFQKYSLAPTEKEIANVVFGSYLGPIDLGIPEKQIGIFMESVFTKVRNNAASAVLHKGVRKTLGVLKEKVRLCVVTSSERDLFEKSLISNGLEDFFEFSITSKDVKKHKPDPEIVHLALKRFGGLPNEALMVGDSDKDVLAGQGAGIDTAIIYPEVNHRFYEKEDLTSLNPTYFLEEFSMLEKVV